MAKNCRIAKTNQSFACLGIIGAHNLNLPNPTDESHTQPYSSGPLLEGEQIRMKHSPQIRRFIAYLKILQ